MTTHAVTCYADTVSVELFEIVEKRLRKLFGDVRVHVVALCPRLLGRVNVEPCARAEIVGIVFTLYLETP